MLDGVQLVNRTRIDWFEPPVGELIVIIGKAQVYSSGTLLCFDKLHYVIKIKVKTVKRSYR